MNGEFLKFTRRVAIAIVASGTVAAAPLYAKTNTLIIVSPACD